MPRAAIHAFDGCYASCVSGFADVLQVANAHLRRDKAAEPFAWDFVSQAGADVRSSNGLPLRTRKPGRGERFDFVFVPSFHYRGRAALDALLGSQAAACDWLRSQWNAGATLAANCTGTFLLAHTGLLDGREATTTWWLEEQFRARFPAVDLNLRPVLTEAERLMCAGASASYLLQAIRVIELCCGPAVASQCAKSMLIDVSQTTQLAVLPLLAQKAHSDAMVLRAQALLKAKLAQTLRIRDVAQELSISERTLMRRFKEAVGQPPLAYLQHLRIDEARAILETSPLPIEEVAARVGYGDTSAFSQLFRKRVGLSPGAYRSRFRPAFR